MSKHREFYGRLKTATTKTVILKYTCNSTIVDPQSLEYHITSVVNSNAEKNHAFVLQGLEEDYSSEEIVKSWNFSKSVK